MQSGDLPTGTLYQGRSDERQTLADVGLGWPELDTWWMTNGRHVLICKNDDACLRYVGVMTESPNVQGWKK